MERATLLFAVLAASISSHVEAASYEDVYNVSCFQNGQLIFKTQERVRDFSPGSGMTLLADISLGQVQETRQRIYASNQAGVVCIVSQKK